MKRKEPGRAWSLAGIALVGFVGLVLAKSSILSALPTSVVPQPICDLRIDSTDSPYPNIKVHSGQASHQSEVSIALDPTDLDRFLIGANTADSSMPGYQGSYRSADQGQTWNGSDYAPVEAPDVGGDPCVILDKNGDAFFSYLYYEDYPGEIALAVSKSINKGASWEVRTIVDAANNPDKPHMATDLAEGDIYLAWTEFGNGKPIFFVKSSEGGEGFASTATNISSPDPENVDFHEFSLGVNLAVGPEGQLYAVWASTSEGDSLMMNRSFDQGDNWAGPSKVLDIDGIRPDGKSTVLWSPSCNYIPPCDSILCHSTNCGCVSGYVYFVAADNPAPCESGWQPCDSLRILLRTASFPSMAVDTGQGPRRGSIYVAWADNRNGDLDVFLVRSSDSGSTWTAPIRVNDDGIGTGAAQFMPWLTVDPQGFIHIVFYDDRSDVTRGMTEVWQASSFDGGQTFTNFLVSDVSVSLHRAFGDHDETFTYMGDYIGIVSNQEMSFPAWNDNRNGEHQVYVARVPTGITGSITANTSWTASQYLRGDIIVEPGVTLTVEPGLSVLTAANHDDAMGGVDTSLVEIIVKGTLIVDGEVGNPVTISSAFGEGLNSWYGIRVVDSGQVILRNARVRNAYGGVSFEGNLAAGSIDSCIIDSCLVYGVYTEADGIRIYGSTFRDIGSYGIRAYTAGLDVVNDTFYRCDYGVYQTDAGLGEADSIVICRFGNGVDTSMIAGVYTKVAPLIKQCGFKGAFQTAAVVTGPTSWAKPKIHACLFDGMDVGEIGIFADQLSRPIVRCSDFIDYIYRDVYCYKAPVNLGKNDDSTVWGNNRMMLPSPDSVAIEAVISSVKAEKNYYYTSTPLDTNFLGPVDWDPYWTNAHSLWNEPGCGYCGCLGGAPPDTGDNQTKIAVEAYVPRTFRVEQNYPNPFNPSTVIHYALPSDAHVRLRVVNILGQVVRTLVDDYRAAGDHRVEWDGRNDAGASVASGVYLYRLDAGGNSYTRKMTLLK